MSVKSQAIIEAMEKFAPKYYAEEWDNIGLQVGTPEREVDKVLVALDCNAAVMEEAEETGAQMLIVHHPLLFKPVHHLRTDFPLGKILARAIKRDLVIYAAHTNLDIAPGGVNDCLAGVLGLERLEVLSVSQQEKLVKIVVFVPAGYEDKVRDAMAEAGAGWIGNYSHCTFQSEGSGTFMPLPGTNPFIGKPGTLEKAREIRLETIAPERLVKRALAAMRRAHPYEEVAYDLYPLANEGRAFGLGRIGFLRESMTLGQLAGEVKMALGASYVRVVGHPGATISKVAVCGGSGGSLIHKAAFWGADCLISGDIKYHEAQEAEALGLAVIDAGHFHTEKMVVPAVVNYLQGVAQELNWAVEVLASGKGHGLFNVF